MILTRQKQLLIAQQLLEQYPLLKLEIMEEVKSLEKAEEIVADLIQNGEVKIIEDEGGIWILPKSRY